MGRQGFLAISAVAALAVIVVGCASEATTTAPGRDAKPADRFRCFNPTFMRGFQTPDDHTVIIESDDNQAYELTMAGPCFGLQDSFAIGVRSRNGMSEVCDPLDADILFRDHAMGERRECRVAGMRHLVGDEAAKYIAMPKKAASASSSTSSSASN